MVITSTEPMVTHRFKIQHIIRETLDSHTIELEPAVSKEKFTFRPGQFNMLYAYGVGEVPISISGDPTDNSKLVHTVRSIGAVSSAICRLKKGSVVGVRGPLGTWWPLDEAKGNDVVIVIGGIGTAPLRGAIYYLLAHRESYGQVVVLYGARSPKEFLFPKLFEQWRGRFDLDVHLTVDTAPSGWRGNVGLVTSLIPRANFDPYHTTALVCGPEVMMRFTIQELNKRGVENSDIYVSMERNMKCGIGHCGHCQLGPFFICKDGPVFKFSEIKPFFEKREI